MKSEPPFYQDKPTLRMFAALTACVVIMVGWWFAGRAKHYLQGVTDEIEPGGSVAWQSHFYVLAGYLIFLAILFGVIFAFRDSLADYGLGPGHWKWSLGIVVITAPIAAFMGWLASTDASVAEMYPQNPHSGDTPALFGFHLLNRFVFYFMWELLFRGVIQHAVSKKAGAPAGIAVQTALSTMAHLGTSLSETIASFFAGIFWGVQAERTRSIWPGVVQHWFVGAVLETMICWF